MRFVLAQPALTTVRGHYLPYLVNLQQELRGRGIDSIALGGAAATADCHVLNGFQPVFSRSRRDRDGVVWRLRGLIDESRDVFRSLEACLIEGRILQGDDIIFVDTVTAEQIVGWGAFLVKHADALRAKKVRVILVLRFRAITSHAGQTALRILLHAFAVGSAAKLLRSSMTLATDTELLQAEWEPLLGLPVHVLPIPQALEDVAPGENDRRPGLAIVSALGGAVDYQGFDLSVGLIEALVRRGRQRVGFRLQLQKQSARSDRTVRAVQTAERLALVEPSIEILPDYLDPPRYATVVATSDLLVLPYRGVHYQRATSGRFTEAVFYGTIPVVPRDTWMAFECARIGLHGVIFEPESLDSLVATTEHVLDRIEEYRQIMWPIRQRWRAFHNRRSFTDTLLDVAGVHPRGVPFSAK